MSQQKNENVENVEMEEKEDEKTAELVEEQEQREEATAEQKDGVADENVTPPEEPSEEQPSEEEALRKEIEELTNRLLRSRADYENLRRRTREELEAQAKYRSQPLVESLLPVIDNFERGLAVKAETEEGKSILQGMNMVYRQLQEVLHKEGVEVIKAVGEKFDPHLHEAVMQVEVEGFESGQIVEELQKGYKLKDRVIRPSMVKVNA